MARRITTGLVGKNVLGSLNTTENSISSAVTDQDIILDPSGTGEVTTKSGVLLESQNFLKFGIGDANANYFGIKAPATMGSTVQLTLPSDAGTNGYVLTTNGSNTLSWENVAVQVGNDIAADSVNPYYLTMTSASSGGINELKVITSKIEIDAADGTLRLKANTASSSTTTGTLVVSGGAGIAGNCYVGGNMVATSIDETSSITLKENLNPITNALDKILELQAFTYDRKDKTNFNEAGLIAEEVNKVIPNIVRKNKNGNPESISYSRLTAYLIESIKELSAQLDILKK